MVEVLSIVAEPADRLKNSGDLRNPALSRLIKPYHLT